MEGICIKNAEASRKKYKQIVLEITKTWKCAIKFYME